MKKIKEVIIVEGRYDKNTIRQVVDCTVIETSGFAIFSDGEKLALIRRLAEARGIIIMTDSDGAGFLIRGHLRGKLPAGSIKHAYIPDIQGREKRKKAPSKEGKLGVEGMRPEVIIDALCRAGATFEDEEDPVQAGSAITKADMFALGLSGRDDSAKARARLMRALDLPERLSPNALLDVLNSLYTRDEFLALDSVCGSLLDDD